MFWLISCVTLSDNVNLEIPLFLPSSIFFNPSVVRSFILAILFPSSSKNNPPFLRTCEPLEKYPFNSGFFSNNSSNVSDSLKSFSKKEAALFSA